MESSSTKGNIRHGKLKSQKELKRITDSEEYKKSDYEGKTKKLNVATANKGMSVGQAKIAAKAPPPNKIDAKDFAVLRAEKAKGRGMGLQDEKVQPGKVQKAALGMLALGVMGKKFLDKKGKSLPPGLGAAALIAKKKKDILGKRMGGSMMKKYSKGGGADSGKVGEMKSRLAVLSNKFKKNRDTDRLTQRDIEFLKEKMKPKGKMGGGMIGSMQTPMQRPMAMSGYKKGTMVKARGCKLGRTRPTKIT